MCLANVSGESGDIWKRERDEWYGFGVWCGVTQITLSTIVSPPRTWLVWVSFYSAGHVGDFGIDVGEFNESDGEIFDFDFDCKNNHIMVNE